ncbi:MAG: DUF1295 domain-containing protein [Spirochaetales bacterium]|nr:DUF1295 domain-containing protein [Spirochaetales bacterium]
MKKRSGNALLSAILYIAVFALFVPGLHFFLGRCMDTLLWSFAVGKSTPVSIIGLFVAAMGIAVVLCGIALLWREGRGFPISSHPPKKLVTTGVYRISRHPIYFGGIITFLGISIIIHSFWNIVLFTPLIALFFLSYAEKVEEPVLLERFGSAYADYSRSVPPLFRYPFRSAVRGAITFLASKISLLINRPFITRKGNHIFFLGYGLWCGAAAVVGLGAVNLFMLAYSIPSRQIRLIIVITTFIAILGSRIVWITGVVVHERKTFADSIKRVGFVSWGMLFGVMSVGIPFMIITGRGIFTWLDMALFALTLTHIVGRIGCLFYGCCYGRETNSRICIRFSHPALKAVREARLNAASLYPTQILSSFNGLIVFVIVLTGWMGGHMPVGYPATLICILYGFFRFIEEQYRAQRKYFLGFFSSAQIVCLCVIAAGIAKTVALLTAGDVSKYEPLRGFLASSKSENIPLVLGLGVVSALVFSYHRHEIGMWGIQREKNEA